MDVKLPRLAEGVESGTVVSILVSEGQQISKDQAFMELETQKAVGSIPSPNSGTVTKIHVKEGMEVSVGQILISIDAAASTGNSTAAAKPVLQTAATNRQPASEQTANASAESATPSPAAAEDYHYESKAGIAPPVAPSVRKIARELGIDLTRVRGSESGGRIALHDVRAYIERLQRLAVAEPRRSAAPVPAAQPMAEAIDFSKWGPVRREKLSPLRRTVSRRMTESWTTIPKINQFDDADITALLAVRKKHAATYEQNGAHLTLTAFILLVLARALKNHPNANSSLEQSGTELVLKDYCHIGVAVDTDAGLIVPVLRDVDKKNLLEISRELHDLTEKTRQRKIGIDDLQGGTFTISNQGSIGGSHFTPIIYAPQVAILGIGQGQNRPVALDGKIAIRTMLPLCLAYDHRVLDGANAVRFMREVIAGLETFGDADVALR